MANTTIDFGAGNTTRYYTLPGFSLSNGDWAIIWWQRFSQPADGARRAVFSTDGIGEGGAINIESAHYDETGYETIAGVWDNNGNGAFFGGLGQAGSYAPGQDILTVVQRRGANVEMYHVPTGVVASGPYISEAHSFISGHNGVSNPTYYIGRRADGTRSLIEPFGEFAVLNNDSLSAAEVTTLAAGAHITAVRATPFIDLRFRESNATELDLGTAGADATRFGSGWTLVTEFFPDSAVEDSLTVDSGSIALAGQSINLSTGLSVQSESLVLQSFDVGLLFDAAYVLPVTATAVVGEGQEIPFILATENDDGELVLAGQNIGLSSLLLLPLDSGNVALSGSDIDLRFGGNVSLDIDSVDLALASSNINLAATGLPDTAENIVTSLVRSLTRDLVFTLTDIGRGN